MSRPSDDELEAMAARLQGTGCHKYIIEAAAMLRACKSGELDIEPLKRWGFAPGGYSCICSECSAIHTADKRAWRCLPCAEKRATLEPAPDARQEAWNAAIEAVGNLRGRNVPKRDAEDVGEAYDLAIDEAQDAIRALAKKGQTND